MTNGSAARTWEIDPYDSTAEQVRRGVLLVVLAGPRVGDCRMVSTGSAMLGRGPFAAIDLVDEEASRRHAIVEVNRSVATIEDLGSRNATYLNGRQVTGRVRLQDGDLIEIGRAVILVVFCLDLALGPSMLVELMRRLLPYASADERAAAIEGLRVP